VRRLIAAVLRRYGELRQAAIDSEIADLREDLQILAAEHARDQRTLAEDYRRARSAAMQRLAALEAATAATHQGAA